MNSFSSSEKFISSLKINIFLWFNCHVTFIQYPSFFKPRDLRMKLLFREKVSLVTKTNKAWNDNCGTEDTCTFKCLCIFAHSPFQDLFMSVGHCSGTVYCAGGKITYQDSIAFFDTPVRMSYMNVLFYILHCYEQEKGKQQRSNFVG